MVFLINQLRYVFQEHGRSMHLKANKKWRLGIVNVDNMLKKPHGAHNSLSVIPDPTPLQKSGRKLHELL